MRLIPPYGCGTFECAKTTACPCRMQMLSHATGVRTRKLPASIEQLLQLRVLEV